MPSTLTGRVWHAKPHKQLVLMVTVLFGRGVMHDKTEIKRNASRPRRPCGRWVACPVHLKRKRGVTSRPRRPCGRWVACPVHLKRKRGVTSRPRRPFTGAHGGKRKRKPPPFWWGAVVGCGVVIRSRLNRFFAPCLLAVCGIRSTYHVLRP